MWPVGVTHSPQCLMWLHIGKLGKDFLRHIFCGVGANSPYNASDFLRIFINAAEHQDFTNNTCIRLGGPDSETAFSRLEAVDFEGIQQAFRGALKAYLPYFKMQQRNRKFVLAFDTTDDPYYGKVQGLWIHPYCEARGSTGCFKYLTVMAVFKEKKVILGSMLLQRGADIVELVEEYLRLAHKYLVIDTVLFDRGFDSYRLVDLLQKKKIRFLIFWRKGKWLKEILKGMENGEMKEIRRQKDYKYERTTHKFKIRYVIIKQHKISKHAKSYDWVFVTNVYAKKAATYVKYYLKRWNIETTFRVLDCVYIKTTTKNPIIRYFLHTFCCLLYNIWKVLIMKKWEISFKNFVYFLFKKIEEIQDTGPPSQGFNKISWGKMLRNKNIQRRGLRGFFPCESGRKPL